MNYPKLISTLQGRRPRTASNEPTRHEGDALGPEEALTKVTNQAIGPEDLTKAPVIVTDPAIIESVMGIAESDAASSNMDVHSRRSSPPSAAFVALASRARLDRLCERAWAVIAQFEGGSYGRVDPARPVRRIVWATKILFGFILLTGGITEIVYGQISAQILTGSTPGFALMGAIGFTLATNLLAWTAGTALYTARPGVLHNAGATIGIWLLLIVFLLAVTLGLVVGGYDPVQTIGTGISGGGETTVDTVTAASGRPLLAIAYAGILVIIVCASFVVHLVDLDRTDRRRVRDTKDAQRAAEQATLSSAAQARVVTEVLRAHVEAIELVHNEGRRIVAEYNAAFARFVDDPDLSWSPAVYDDTAPEWVRALQVYAAKVTPREEEVASKSTLTIVA